tara:strand:+ start:171 stop:1307 length:1137 start_codon:yes stop_codon:yes gene_type:complete
VVDTFNADAPLVAAGTGGGPYTGAVTLTLNTVPINKGGTNMTSYTQGDLLYAPTGVALDGLGIGTAGQVLKVNAGATAPEWSSDTDTTYTAGDGLDLTGTVFSADLKANSGIVIDTTELALDLSASSITGTLAAADGGTGLTSISTLLNSNAVVNAYTNGTDNNILTSSGAAAINGESNFTYNGATGALAVTGQFVATANAGTNTAISGIASNDTSTQGWNTSLGVANFDQNSTNTNSTTIAVNTESTGGRLVSFYYQENSGTGPKGEIKYDTGTSQVQYNVTSDYRLKENIVDLSSAVDRVKNLKPKRFNFVGNSTEIDGFLAHEVQEVVPQAVSGAKDQVFDDGQVNPQQMDASKLIPVLTAAIKELTARIEALEG